MVSTKKTLKERKNKTQGTKKDKTLEKKERWKKIKNLNFVPGDIKTEFDLKKKLFNNSKNLINQHNGVTIKNIKKKVKDFGFDRKRTVKKFNEDKKPVFETIHIYKPPQEAVNAIPELKFKKKRFMYSKDSAQVITFLLLTETKKAKERIYNLKRNQPKKGGYGLISTEDLDIVFGNGKGYNKQKDDDDDVDMDKVNNRAATIKLEKSTKFGKFGKKNNFDEKEEFARIMWKTWNKRGGGGGKGKKKKIRKRKK
jgi:hypothetical protein